MVVAHVDGDTIDVSLGDRVERIRLIGIDTPEAARGDRPEECFASEATERLAAIAPVGTALRLERDVVPRDDYGRLLAYAYLADGTMANLALVEAGVARPMTIEPNDTHASAFVEGAHRAQRTGRGLWSACRRGATRRDRERSQRSSAVA